MYRMLATFAGLRYVGVPLKPDFTWIGPALLAAIGSIGRRCSSSPIRTIRPAICSTATSWSADRRGARGWWCIDEAYMPSRGDSFLPRTRPARQPPGDAHAVQAWAGRHAAGAPAPGGPRGSTSSTSCGCPTTSMSSRSRGARLVLAQPGRARGAGGGHRAERAATLGRAGIELRGVTRLPSRGEFHAVSRRRRCAARVRGCSSRAAC